MRLFAIGLCALILGACGTASDPEGSSTAVTDTAPIEAEVVASAPDAIGAECAGFANVMCPTGYYCQKPVGQCLEVMDGAGTCQIQPEVCTREYRPVCGCNGQTYANACTAATEGVSVAAEGECGEILTE